MNRFVYGFLVIAFACCGLGGLTSCQTTGQVEFPDVDPLSQQDQMQWRKSRLTKSPYTRSGI